MDEQHHDRSEDDFPKIETAFIISQLQQSQEAYRLTISLTAQILTVLMVGNITLVGYAISQKIAGIMLIGPLFPLGMLVAVMVGRRSALPIAYTIANLEYKYGKDSADWIGRTFLSVFVNTDYVLKLIEIGQLPTFQERMARLRQLPGPLVGTGKGIVRALFVLLSIVELAASLVLWNSFGWRMF